MSAPSTSQGIVILYPAISAISSSMNSILSLAAKGFIPVDAPTSNCWTVPFS